MSNDEPRDRSTRKPSRRRRRRRRPGSGASPDRPGSASSPAEGKPAPGDKPQAKTTGPEGGSKRSSRRKKRRPSAQQGQGDGRPREASEAGRQTEKQEPRAAAARSRKRGRRRRRKQEPPRAAPEETRREQEPAAQAADEGPLAFPDEGEWELDEPGTPPPRPRPPEESTITDPDDLVLELDAETDDEAPPPDSRLRNVVLVRFREAADVTAFDAGDLNLRAGEQVVVETDQGLTIGSVARGSHRTMVRGPVPRLLRRLDANDLRQEARNASREREAFEICRERIRQRRLPMKLIRVEYLHGGNKAMFYFAAEHRVDFRDLVKDLAQRLHTRIVMRQVGVRDEAKMTGGIGSCGMPLCCAGWLPKFEPVSIRMAKDQNLVLNPQKVSGQCGRLKCCLTYEQAVYQEARRQLPKAGRMVRTPDGQGKVLELDILRGIVKVGLGEGKVESYSAGQIEPLAPAGKPPAKG